MTTTRTNVLLIEDDPLHAQIIEGMIVSEGGLYHLECVDRLANAMGRLAGGDIDLILLDLSLPDSDGLETFTELHANFPNIPIVVITAMANDEIAVSALQAGAQDFLIKWQMNAHLLQRSMRYAIERKQAQLALQQQQLAIRNLADSLPEIVCLFDLGTRRIIYGNHRAARLFGGDLTPAGIDDLRSIAHPDDAEKLNASLNHLIGDPAAGVSETEIRIRDSKGEWRWLDCRLVVYRRDGDGRPEQLLYTAHDITGRKLDDAVLRESEERYRDLIENSGLYIGTHDGEGKILSANREVLDFLGVKSANELIGRNIMEFLPERGRLVFRKYLDSLGEQGQPEGIAKFKSPGGRSIIVEYTNSVSHDPAGNLIVRCVGRDVTKRSRAEAQLRESEERLRLALTGAQMGAWEWNLSTDRMIGDEYVQGLLDMNGGGLDAFVENVHPDDRQLALDGARAVVKNKEMHNLQFRIIDAAGRERWVESNASLRMDNLGQPVRVIGVLQDITERKQSEESYRLLSLAVQNAEDAVLITTAHLDPPGPRIVFANPSFLKMTGYSAEELSGETPRILQGPKTDLAIIEQQREAMSRGESFSGETVNYRKDGSEYTVQWHISPVRDQSGEITHLISVQRNVSARLRTEERMHQQAALLDNAQDAIIVRDLNDEALYWSRGAQRLYGWTFDDVRGKKLTDLLHREPPPEAGKIRHALFSQGVWSGELRQVTKDGREITVQARWSLLRDAGERPKSVLVINTDATEKKRLESMMLRAQRLESIGALASGIAHDLNNVLAPILMALHTLQQRFTDESSQRWLSLIHKSAERGRDLIDQVLSFAKGAEGERSPLQISHLIKDISKILQETLPKNIDLQVVVPEGAWTVIGDTTQIHQVLMNLCINARDAMPDGGRLQIKARNRYLVEEEERLVTNPHQKQYVRITVADTGVGISPEIIDRVFDPFFTTKGKGQGSGLGLSTVQGIVRGHGGFVNVISQVGKGTEFKIYLPAQDIPVADAVEDGIEPLPAGHGELILVVDDEADIREVTSRTLESNGYRVIVAKDGKEAVEMYRTRGAEIHLVLTDMVMPNLDGPGTIRALKQIDPNVLVVATSGVRTTGKLAEATQVGAKTFLPKPYTAERLLLTIANAFEEKRTAP